ncbi:hypothetical protein [Okeania sp. SIO2F5]|nr:hypothetical protein [Okeania sp. SIO2F5]NEP94517.1 hypothetical protein [Okeania sp. SIO2F5]
MKSAVIHSENPLELLSCIGEIIAVFKWVAQIFVGYIPIRLDNCFHPNEKHYSNPILFVAKILLLFRQQATGNRQQVRVSTFLFTF